LAGTATVLVAVGLPFTDQRTRCVALREYRSLRSRLAREPVGVLDPTLVQERDGFDGPLGAPW